MEPALPSGSDESGAAPAAGASPAAHGQPEGAAVLAKIGRYLAGEVELSAEDFRLLSGLNLATADKYSEMADFAAGLVALTEKLQDKSAALMPQLAQLDDLAQQVGELEAAIEQLDRYSRRLESRFEALV